MSFERLYARALLQLDPVEALRRLARDGRVAASTRQKLARVDEDGVRLTALLVARLRFERLLRGSPEAERWYDEDPASFTEAFRRYHAEVRPTAFSPPAEAKLWATFVQGWSRRMAPLPESAR